MVNLCVEKNRRYPLDQFEGQPVMEFGFEDHNPRKNCVQHCTMRMIHARLYDYVVRSAVEDDLGVLRGMQRLAR